MVYHPLGILASLLFCIAKIIFNKLQTLFWNINGIQDKIKNIQHSKHYEECVHVQKIWIRYVMVDWFSGNKSDFILGHHMFTHPDCLLSANVTLYDITPEEAIFVETDPNVNIYDSDVAIFVRIAQFKHAERVMTMPIWAFHKFANKLGNPTGKVILLSNTGRCGSTLLTQIFESAQECLSISEPSFLTKLCIESKLYSPGDMEKTICSCIQVLCKPMTEGYSTIVIKTMSMSLGLVPMLVKEMPNVKHIFMYRSLWPTIQSIYKLGIGSHFSHFFVNCFLRLFPRLRLYALENDAAELLGPEKVHCLQQMVLSPKVFFMYPVLACVALYQHYLGVGLPIVAVRYEDLKHNPDHSIRAVFKYCGFSSDLVPRALTSMSRDSQRGSSLSKGSLKSKISIGEYEGDNKDNVDALCHLFDVPPPGDDQVLPNTITWKEDTPQ